MKKQLFLYEIDSASIDAILSLPETHKIKYFKELVETFYPNTEQNSEEFISLVENYYSSFYVEKLYRSNMFFNEKFTVIYTDTGLIRNIIPDMYYCGDDLIVH